MGFERLGRELSTTGGGGAAVPGGATAARRRRAEEVRCGACGRGGGLAAPRSTGEGTRGGMRAACARARARTGAPHAAARARLARRRRPAAPRGRPAAAQGGGDEARAEGASGDETDAAGGDAPGQAERGSAYYKGMVTSPLRPEDASRDMLTPTLKLIGQATVVLTFLTLGFMASNGLL